MVGAIFSTPKHPNNFWPLQPTTNHPFNPIPSWTPVFFSSLIEPFFLPNDKVSFINLSFLYFRIEWQRYDANLKSRLCVLGSIYTNQNAAAAMSAMQISSSAAAAAAGAPAVMAPGISSLGALSRWDAKRILSHIYRDSRILSAVLEFCNSTRLALRNEDRTSVRLFSTVSSLSITNWLGTKPVFREVANKLSLLKHRTLQ